MDNHFEEVGGMFSLYTTTDYEVFLLARELLLAINFISQPIPSNVCMYDEAL